MSEFLALFGILGALLVGAISPGPSFVLVSRIAATGTRADGLAAALGMGVGGALFAVLALFGLVAILMQVEWLYLTLRVLGGAYLVYLGIRIWLGAREPLKVDEAAIARPPSVLRSFVIGFVTQVSNPKTAIVYASIFAAFLPGSAPFWLFLALPPLVFLQEAVWFAIVALAFSASGPRSVYLWFKTWFDRTAGAVIGALGARLVSETVLSRG